MVSISGFKTASHGASYFEKDSYYQHGQRKSSWYGTGSNELGLSGIVHEEDFSKVLNGFDTNSKPLVKNCGLPFGKEEAKRPELLWAYRPVSPRNKWIFFVSSSLSLISMWPLSAL